jgi:uncharacterized protein (TIGR00661 family)
VKRVLYGIQGTGNGHLSRAREVIPHLLEYAELDLLVSGTQADIDLPHPVQRRHYGLSYAIGKEGTIDLLGTLRSMRPYELLRDIKDLKLNEYDLVISDFEPITSWAGRLQGVPVVGLSHQASFLSDKSPRPDYSNILAEGIFRYYAPCTKAIGFHFESYDHFIRKPIIRSEVRALKPSSQEHVTVYLPAYRADYLKQVFHQIKEVRWEIFSRDADGDLIDGNVRIRRINSNDYLESLQGCLGLLTGGGFEAPSEALFLGKLLMVVPMEMQYEQQCNAVALRRMGVSTLHKLSHDQVTALRYWLKSQKTIHIPYENETANLVKELIT